MARTVLSVYCLAIAFGLSFVAAPAHAESSAPPARTSTLIVYGSDPCPAGDDGEIVVCAREPESERYRIPKKLRDKAVEQTGARSWGGSRRRGGGSQPGTTA